MIKSVSTWAGSIVIAVIVVTLLEMLLPDSKNKKYIKTVMSIYILFTIVSPIVKAFTGANINLESIIDANTTIVMSNNINMQTSSSIENIYMSNIKKDISAKLKQKGYDVLDVDLSITKDEGDDYGKIQSINIIINKNEKAKQSNIPKIEISIGDTGLKKELSNEYSITENEIQELSKFLEATYEVPTQKIIIKEAKE